VHTDQLDQAVTLAAVGWLQCVIARLVVGKTEVGLRYGPVELLVHKLGLVNPPECL
jgi:hypothetical protein